MADSPDAYIIDPKLKEWATDRQAELLDAVNLHGSNRAAARELGIHKSVVDKALAALRRRAAASGFSPGHDMTKTVPRPFVVKGISSFYGPEGELRGQWVKTSLDGRDLDETLREFTRYLREEVRGLAPLVPAPPAGSADLLSLYGLGDPHFGMYAWAQEAGDDFDLLKAETLTTAAIDRLVECGPASDTGLLLNAGDFLHADNAKNVTPESGHSLDVDTRHAKVIQVALRAMVHCILRMLEKHQRVIVWILPGNHDPTSSFAIALCVASFFHNEPRVEVDLSPSLYKYMRFGRVLIGAHHGHGAKLGDLPLLMATDRPEDWGQTAFRYWYGGHIHHKVKDKECPGVVVETLRTLAPRDAWHAGKGYRAGRDAQLIVHHREFGEWERHRCDAAMVEHALAEPLTNKLGLFAA